MRFHIKKTTTKLNILFFTATVWAGLMGYDSNSGLVWVDSLFLFWNGKLPGTGFSQLKKEQRGTSYGSQDLRSEPTPAKSIQIPLVKASKAHKWRGGDILVGCTKCWGPSISTTQEVKVTHHQKNLVLSWRRKAHLLLVCEAFPMFPALWLKDQLHWDKPLTWEACPLERQLLTFAGTFALFPNCSSWIP